MSIINLNLLNEDNVCNGKQLTFTTPCSYEGVTGISILGVEYTLVNAEGNEYVSNGGKWCSGAYMTIMLDVDNNKAYVVNEHSSGSNYEIATTTSDGLMSSTDKVKLDSLKTNPISYINYSLAASNWNSGEVIELPYDFYWGSVVVYNNEIHILGGSNGDTNHYKYDGSSWTSVSTIPYKFYYSSAVVYNNEIHILGSVYSSYRKYHYKYDGSSWTSVSTLPYEFDQSSAIVYNNEIHIIGGNKYRTNHYKYDGSSWTSVSTLPYRFYIGSAVVYNNEIHILGGNDSNSTRINHYKYDGSTWTSVSTLPYSFHLGSAVVYNNEIHILGSDSSSYYKSHYKFDGSSWTSVSTLPYEFHYGSAVVYNNEIHIMGGSGGKTKHYKYNSSTWNQIISSPNYSFESEYPSSSYDLEIWGAQESITDEEISVLSSANMVGNVTKNAIICKGDVPTIDIPIILKTIKK